MMMMITNGYIQFYTSEISEYQIGENVQKVGQNKTLVQSQDYEYHLSIRLRAYRLNLIFRSKLRRLLFKFKIMTILNSLPKSTVCNLHH